MIRFFRLYKNTSNDFEPVMNNALVLYLKKPHTFTTVVHDGGKVEVKPIQFRKFLYVDLWVMKFDFTWYSPKTSPPEPDGAENH